MRCLLLVLIAACALLADIAVTQQAPIEGDATRDAFNQVWNAYDREYPMFGMRDGVDWAEIGDRYRPIAESAKTTHDLAAVMAEMLANLKDLRTWVRVGDESVPVYSRPRPLNASWKACEKLIGKLEMRGDFAWRRMEGGVGYVNIFRLSDPNLPKLFDEALDKLDNTWALIIDLRFNGGSGEELAQKIAGRFVDTQRVYSINQVRSGPKHDDLGPKLERTVAPRGEWLYRAPILVLIGQKTMSSAESLALMLAQAPGAALMGERTAGASGNSRVLELSGGIRVSLPRSIDFRPDGVPLEKEGVVPQVRTDAKPGDFTDDQDPVLEAALKRLNETPKEKRLAAKRD